MSLLWPKRSPPSERAASVATNSQRRVGKVTREIYAATAFRTTHSLNLCGRSAWARVSDLPALRGGGEHNAKSDDDECR
jgi:hypothetical protein